jgi:prepilin peptidase CpaA
MQSLDEQTLDFIAWALRLFVLGLLLTAAVKDWVKFRIPNSISLILFFAGLAFVSFAPRGVGLVSPEIFGSAGFKPHLIAFSVTLVLGFLLFALKLWGAGDAKLLAAVSVWNPYVDLPILFLSVCCVGGLVALAITIARGTLKTTVGNLRGIFMGAMVGAPMSSAALTSGGSRMPFSLAIAGGWCVYAFIRLTS